MNPLPVEFADSQDLADGASGTAKRQLVDRVWPRLGERDTYLDQHDDDAAQLPGRLAEGACEVGRGE